MNVDEAINNATRAITRYTDKFGDEITDLDNVIVNAPELKAHLQRLIAAERLKDFKRMREYYGRGNLKLWDEPDNNLNPVYLDEYITQLTHQANGETV